MHPQTATSSELATDVLYIQNHSTLHCCFWLFLLRSLTVRTAKVSMQCPISFVRHIVCATSPHGARSYSCSPTSTIMCLLWRLFLPICRLWLLVQPRAASPRQDSECHHSTRPEHGREWLHAPTAEVTHPRARRSWCVRTILYSSSILVDDVCGKTTWHSHHASHEPCSLVCSLVCLLARVVLGTFGGQAGADPTRVIAAMKLPGMQSSPCPFLALI